MLETVHNPDVSFLYFYCPVSLCLRHDLPYKMHSLLLLLMAYLNSKSKQKISIAKKLFMSGWLFSFLSDNILVVFFLISRKEGSKWRAKHLGENSNAKISKCSFPVQILVRSMWNTTKGVSQLDLRDPGVTLHGLFAVVSFVSWTSWI